VLLTALEDRFRAALGERNTPSREESIQFAVEFTRLLARVLPEEVSVEARRAMQAALTARSDLQADAIALLIDMALAPEYRAVVEDRELRAFGARFGHAEEEALRAVVSEEVNLRSFADKYGAAEGLLLLDSLFAVCAVDGVIDRGEISQLQQAATELGIDPMLVGALFRKHDSRYATGDFAFKLELPRYVIGRSNAAGIQLPDPTVAVKHAEVVRQPDGSWRIVDLGSGRPTLLNGNPISSAPLRPGDSLRLGPYTLSLDKAQTTLTAFGTRSFSALSVRNLKRKIGKVSLLDAVSFTVFSGEVIAVVGPSGGGKTTLLSAIAGIAPADTGDVLLDGQDFHQLLANDRSIVGIVPQDDVVHPELTVEESLFYSGRLRFPKDVGTEAIQAEVDRVLEELSIAHIRSSRIGDALRRGISGGQRKRVSLGQELLTRSTKVLFLDEPTSGLDPQTAQEIVSLVRQLADDGRIIFIVTHDVTPSVMSMVDHLLVLAPGGRLAWFGPPDEGCAYFGTSSADEIFAKLQEAKPEDWGNKYRESQSFRKFVRTREHLLGLDGLEVEKKGTRARVVRSVWLQYRTLTRRYAMAKLRDRTGTFVLLAQAPILALAMWIVFPAPDMPMIFMLALSALWFGASGSVRELIADRTIWRREARVGLGTLPYIASKVSVLGALVVGQCTLLAAMNWALLRMFDYGFSAFELIFVTSLTGLVGMSLGLMMSSIFNSSEAAVGTLPVVLIPQITFGGLVVKLKDMSPLSRWISSGMITRYAFDAMIKTGSEISVTGIRGNKREHQGIMFELYNYGFRTSDSYDVGVPFRTLVLVLLGFLVVFLMITTLITKRSEVS
jgi:ABC-type multidrug transport system ATPase subunit